MEGTFSQAFIRGYLSKVAQTQTAGDSWRQSGPIAPSPNWYGNMPSLGEFTTFKPLRDMFSSKKGSKAEFTLSPESLKGVPEIYGANKASQPKVNPKDAPAGPLKPA